MSPLVKKIFVIAGIFYTILGVAIFFDAGGLFTGYFGTEPYIGEDIAFNHLFGSLLFLLGIVAVFVVPAILFRKNEDRAE